MVLRHHCVVSTGPSRRDALGRSRPTVVTTGAVPTTATRTSGMPRRLPGYDERKVPGRRGVRPRDGGPGTRQTSSTLSVG